MGESRVNRRAHRVLSRLRHQPAGEAARIEHIASEGALADRLRALSWHSTHRRRRLRLHLAPGTYHLRLDLIDGLDLSGPATIVWDGPGDTINSHGVDSRLTDLTVQHLGPDIAYGIHHDAPSTRSTLTLERVDVSSESKPALGVGLAGGQRVSARSCRFTSTDFAAVFAHPWHDQHEPAVLRFVDCHAVAPNGAGLCWRPPHSGQLDELHWDGPIDAPTLCDGTPPVLRLAGTGR